MFDKDLVAEIIRQILNSIQKTIHRFSFVPDLEYFTYTTEGQEKLDAICMQLIAIGESLKNLDKITKNELLKNYPEVDWKGAKSMRDIISHHYFDIDAEIVYDVCETKLHSLELTLN